MHFSVPFNRASFSQTSTRYALDALQSGHVAGDGPYTKKCRHLLEQELRVNAALLTTSCTHALEMMALLLDIKHGDEVILPSFTFVSCPNAFVLQGARPVFADISTDTLNIDPDHAESLITPRTKAILLVHYAGVGCDMAKYESIARRHGIVLLEDTAHALFGKYDGRYLGTFGSLASLSFHETKNFTCGEGGALLINDASLIERAEIIREKGTNRSRFFRGQVDKYSWVDVGSSYLASDVLAALLLGQLEEREQIQAARRAIWEQYDVELNAWAEHNGVRRPAVPTHCEQTYHMYYLIMPSLNHRQAFIAHLKAQGVQSVFHYLPLHLSEMGKRWGYVEGACPVTEDLSDRLVRLPVYSALTQKEQSQVISAALSFQAADL